MKTLRVAPFVALFLLFAAAPRAIAATVSFHDLAVRIDPAAGTLAGTGKLTVDAPAGAPLELLLGTDYKLESAVLEPEAAGGKAVPLTIGTPKARAAQGETGPANAWPLALSKKQAKGKVVLAVRWTGKVAGIPKSASMSREEVADMPNAYLDPQGAYFAPEALWFPTGAQQTSLFRLDADVPAAWHVVSEGRLLKDAGSAGDTARREVYESVHPLEGVHLVAAPWRVFEEEHNGQRIAVYVLPGTEDDLAKTYLGATIDAVDRYTAKIGPHAWPQFLVVEHVLPTGYGMPSFTLLGAGVMRLPFIVRTSLPHEVLHDWWGNGVFVDRSKGNWCEGLTAYMADHDLAGEQSPRGDVEYRRQILRDYTEYVSKVAAGKEPAIANFRERHDRATRALGYGKVAMVFHMIRQRIGDERFVAGLRDFYAKNLYRDASWGDVQNAFAHAAPDEKLAPFFKAWVEQPGAPSVTLGEVRTAPATDGFRTTIELRADGDFPGTVTVALFGAKGETARGRGPLTAGRATLAVNSAFAPVRVLADPDVDYFRRLAAEEIPATLARLLAAPPDLVIIGTGRGEEITKAARAAASAVAQDKGEVIMDTSVDAAKLAAARRVWLLGAPGATFRDFIAKHLPYGAALDPDALRLSGQEVKGADAALVAAVDYPAPGQGALGIVDALSAQAFTLTARRMTHYGKYSYLLFDGQQAKVKAVADAPVAPLDKKL